jgi:hypothetical protein
MLPTKSTLLASPAAVIWSHTRGLQQVISVIESPSSTFRKYQFRVPDVNYDDQS